MLKSFLLGTLLMCLLLTAASCASSSGGSTKTGAATEGSAYPFMIGRIEVIGNEPYTKLALRIDPTHVFLLRASKDLEKDLASHQQGVVKLFYSGRQESGVDHYLVVDHIEIPEK